LILRYPHPGVSHGSETDLAQSIVTPSSLSCQANKKRGATSELPYFKGQTRYVSSSDSRFEV